MFDNWPDLVPISRVKKDCHFSNKKIYSLVKRKDFPSIRLGDKFYIIKAGFIKWLEEEAKKDKAHRI